MVINKPTKSDFSTINLRNQKVAKWLINKFELLPGYGLSLYLNLPMQCDNYTAICLWAQSQLHDEPVDLESLEDLACVFLELLPQHIFQ